MSWQELETVSSVDAFEDTWRRWAKSNLKVASLLDRPSGNRRLLPFRPGTE